MVYSSSILTPIQTGRAIASEIFDEMIGDDTGENISFLNESFCELTAIYWAWKNYDTIGNPDCIGFMQYRRCFIFNKKYDTNKHSGIFYFESSNEDTWKDINLDDKNINEILIHCKNVIPKKFIIDETIEEQYKNNHYAKDFDELKKILFKLHPEQKDKFLSFCSGNSIHWFMMFILKKEIFFKYCEWIFPILFELHNSISTEEYSEYQKRAIAFMAERLTGFFLQELSSYSPCKELPIAFFKNADPYLKPSFKENFIPIVISCSDYYTPYIAVFLQSLIDNMDHNYNYDVIIITSSMSEYNKYNIKKNFTRKNICIRYSMPHELYSSFKLYGHMSHETYYRFDIPYILKNYDKCIFFDADIIINDSLVDLYNINIKDFMFAAVRNTMITLLYNSDDNLKKYYKEYNITMNRYIQSGVLLMNLDKCRKNDFKNQCVQAYRKNKFLFLDQDTLTFLFNSYILFIDNKWNYETYQTCFDGYRDYMDQDIEQIRKNALIDVKIIHYASQNKPWLYPNEELAEKWWSYAKKTPYYETCIKRMIEHTCNDLIASYCHKRHINFKLKYYQYYILSKFVFGKLGKKYMKKKVYYRNQLKNK